MYLGNLECHRVKGGFARVNFWVRAEKANHHLFFFTETISITLHCHSKGDFTLISDRKIYTVGVYR